MDLDTLKKSWQELELEYKGVDKRHLKEMVTSNSKTVLAKIRQNMFIDILSGIVAIVAVFAIVVFLQNSSISIIGLVLAGTLLAALVGLAYPRFYRSSKQESLSSNIRTSLEQNIASLEKDLRFYKRLNNYLYPLAVLTGLLIDQNTLDYLQNKMAGNDIRFVVIAALLALALFPLYQLMVKWWSGRMYGRYIDRLKIMLNELKEQS